MFQENIEENAKNNIDITHLLGNSSSRLASRDMFMLMALWMEHYPRPEPKTSQTVRKTGCALIDQRDRVVGLDRTGEAHAIVRAITKCHIDPRGCDIYVSRFPCSMCTKMMVQAGIRKIYYFPAAQGEVDWDLASPQTTMEIRSGSFVEASDIIGASVLGTRFSPVIPPAQLADRKSSKIEHNFRSVSRLITNNPIALTLYIPRWNEAGQFDPSIAQSFWELDQSLSSTPSLANRWGNLVNAFENTQWAFSQLVHRYRFPAKPTKLGMTCNLDSKIMQHAIILAHIASKRTDDPKVGVGAVLIDPSGNYASVGWNGFPKRSASTDYPQAGADDFVEDAALKYDYILHAGIHNLPRTKRAFVEMPKFKRKYNGHYKNAM